MRKPTDTEKIQLIAVLRVVDLSQDEVASTLHLAKLTVGDTENWIKNENFQVVWDVFEDNVLKITVLRELPFLKKGEAVTDRVLMGATQVNRASILAHYGRKAPDIIPEEDTKQSRNNLAWSRKIHLDALAGAAQKLRSRIVNPDIRKRPFTEEKPLWDWNGFNWRVAPSYWLAMMVPLLGEIYINAWISNWENLLSHLADSRFRKHYDELEKGVVELQDKFNELIAKLKVEDPRWGDEWERFTDHLGEWFVDGRAFQPDTITPKVTIDEIISNLTVSNEFIKDTARRFKEYCPDLDKRCDQLENLLQQVYDDLDTGIVSREIEAGKCPDCP